MDGGAVDIVHRVEHEAKKVKNRLHSASYYDWLLIIDYTSCLTEWTVNQTTWATLEIMLNNNHAGKIFLNDLKQHVIIGQKWVSTWIFIKNENPLWIVISPHDYRYPQNEKWSSYRFELHNIWQSITGDMRSVFSTYDRPSVLWNAMIHTNLATGLTILSTLLTKSDYHGTIGIALTINTSLAE